MKTRNFLTICFGAVIGIIFLLSANDIQAYATEKDRFVNVSEAKAYYQEPLSKGSLKVKEECDSRMGETEQWVRIDGVREEDYVEYYKKSLLNDTLGFCRMECYFRLYSPENGYWDTIYDERYGMNLRTGRIRELSEHSKKNEEAAAKAMSEIHLKKWDNQLMAVKKIMIYIAKNYEYKEDLNYAESLYQYKKGNCNAYADAFYDMCRSTGIPCQIVVGYTEQNGEMLYHAWNRVELEGQWYYTDAAFADGAAIDGEVYNETYFLSKELWRGRTIEAIF